MGKIPQNRNFGGMNKCFQAKHTKYVNFHVIKTTNSNQILHTNKDHLVCAMGDTEMQKTNPKWQMAAILKIINSIYLPQFCQIYFMKLHKVMHIRLSWPLSVVKISIAQLLKVR